MSNDKYNLMYILKQHETGSGLHAIFLSNTYSNLFNAINFCKCNLPKEKRIWLLHKPSFYRYPNVARLADINCVRVDHIKNIIGLKATNGYSYYRRYLSKYNIWFPTIYDSNFDVNDTPSIGFYSRDMRMQSTYAFLDFIKKLPIDIPIVTMGDEYGMLKKHLNNNKNWHHTYSNKEFWRSCSHYFYYRPSTFEDPVPHTLLEAIQSGHRIISPKDDRRNFVDGIDDFLSCIKYDISFNENECGKKCKELTSFFWRSKLEFLVENSFNDSLTIKSTGLLYDWICSQL